MSFLLNRRKGFAAAGAFDPLSLSPALWLDASDASTLYDATTGGSLVAADGTVARWEDKSGNDRHATQGTGASQPLRKTSIQNGNDIVRFDGSDDFLGFSASFMSGAGTAVYVCRADADPAAAAISAGAPLGDWGSAELANHFPWTDSNVYDDFGCTVRKNPGNPTPSLASYRIISQISDTDAWSIHIDGSLFYSTATSTTGWGSVPKIARSFNQGNTNHHYDGDIAEVLIFPSSLSTTDREAVESYLNAKWAIY